MSKAPLQKPFDWTTVNHKILIQRKCIPSKMIDILEEECFEIVHKTGNNSIDIPAVLSSGCILQLDNNHLAKNKEMVKMCSLWTQYQKIRRQTSEKQGFLNFQLLAQHIQSLFSCPLYFFHEQYVVKPPKSKNSEFDWHCDDDYFPKHNNNRYISVWIPLVSVNQKNGTLCINQTNPSPLLLEPGDIAIIASNCIHSSYPNLSFDWRYCYLIQFSFDPSVSVNNNCGHSIKIDKSIKIEL